MSLPFLSLSNSNPKYLASALENFLISFLKVFSAPRINSLGFSFSGAFHSPLKASSASISATLSLCFSISVSRVPNRLNCSTSVAFSFSATTSALAIASVASATLGLSFPTSISVFCCFSFS